MQQHALLYQHVRSLQRVATTDSGPTILQPPLSPQPVGGAAVYALLSLPGQAKQNNTLRERLTIIIIIIIITQLVTRHKSITISDESQTRDRRVSLAERATV